MTSPPKVLYVGATDYTVKVRSPKAMDRDRLLGETDTSNTEITLNRKQSKSSLQNTVLHEVLHAILWTSGYNRNMPMDVEEPLVQALTPWLLAVLRDNPDLLTFLLEDHRG